MDEKSGGRAIGMALCDMLGIPSADVRSITVTADYQDNCTVTVVMLKRNPDGRHVIEAGRIAEIQKHFRLVESGSVDG
jgi:hypothetical protein